jgi:hypothetical protein
MGAASRPGPRARIREPPDPVPSALRAHEVALVGEDDRLHPVAEPGLARIRATQVFTVASPRKSSAATSAFDSRPSRSSRR